jgi:hypothetical protein
MQPKLLQNGSGLLQSLASHERRCRLLHRTAANGLDCKGAASAAAAAAALASGQGPRGLVHSDMSSDMLGNDCVWPPLLVLLLLRLASKRLDVLNTEFLSKSDMQLKLWDLAK